MTVDAGPQPLPVGQAFAGVRSPSDLDRLAPRGAGPHPVIWISGDRFASGMVHEPPGPDPSLRLRSSIRATSEHPRRKSLTSLATHVNVRAVLAPDSNSYEAFDAAWVFRSLSRNREGALIPPSRFFFFAGPALRRRLAGAGDSTRLFRRGRDPRLARRRFGSEAHRESEVVQRCQGVRFYRARRR